jgi:hypothetical protein
VALDRAWTLALTGRYDHKVAGSAKLLFVRDRGSTEVGGFGITLSDDLLYVEDIRLVRQTCTAVSVAFDDTAVAEFFDEQIDTGLRPEQFGRIWACLR